MIQEFNAFHSHINIELAKFCDIPSNIDYSKKHELLSSVNREIHVSLDKKYLYSCDVPKHVFNPYGSLVPRRIVELIINGTIQTKGRKVIDLGCGCGLIGLAAILMEAQQILFSDINPNVITLQQHPLLRIQDEVKIQDILTNELTGSWDTIIACPPSQNLERDAITDNYESGIFLSGDLILRIMIDAARVLKPGGEFFLYVRLPHHNFMDCYPFMMQLNQYFDLSTMNMLDFAIGKDFTYGDPDTNALFFSIKKQNSINI